MKIEKCPYHNVDPEYAVDVFREKLQKKYLDSNDKEIQFVLPELAEYYWFCPKCFAEIKSGEFKGRARTKLGRGYHSYKSKNDALRQWNAGVCRMIPAILRAAARGKEA